MKVLFITEALSVGGIEVLALRYAEAFGAAGHDVTLYDFEPSRRAESLVQNFDQTKFRITGLSPSPVLNWLIWKANALSVKTGIMPAGLRQRLLEKHFANLVKTGKFDIICTLSFHADYYACKYGVLYNSPVVVWMHGIYEAVSPNHPTRARFIYERVSAIIYGADKNMSYYMAQAYYQPNMPTYKLYTGTSLTTVPSTIVRADLGISVEEFVYIMVARGIKEKGWEEAIKAFLSVRQQHKKTKLLLVGDGVFLQQMKAQYAAETDIIFYGFHSNPVEITAIADVGLLPSYFSAETMPNVVIDYLRCGLPVIASVIGEVPGMLQDAGGQAAGILLPLSPDSNRVSVTELAKAMEDYITRPELYMQHLERVQEARQKFDIKTTLVKYVDIFEMIIKKYREK
jgi:glycosyltransferase involved in cell wall biosynthesis